LDPKLGIGTMKKRYIVHEYLNFSLERPYPGLISWAEILAEEGI
jgi:hypothetical protein